LRRIIAIFGNYDSEVIRRLFIKISSLLSKNSDDSGKVNPDILGQIQDLLTTLINEAIISELGGKNTCSIILKHCNENSFSPTDSLKFVESLNMSGYNVKGLFVDYVDVMVPSSTNYTSYDDYNAQGIIIQEFRLLSRIMSIPVFSITQNAKSSEHGDLPLSNTMIGDKHNCLPLKVILMYKLREFREV